MEAWRREAHRPFCFLKVFSEWCTSQKLMWLTPHVTKRVSFIQQQCSTRCFVVLAEKIFCGLITPVLWKLSVCTAQLWSGSCPTESSWLPSGENSSCTTATSWKPAMVQRVVMVCASQTMILGRFPTSPVAMSVRERSLGTKLANETMSSVCSTWNSCVGLPIGRCSTTPHAAAWYTMRWLCVYRRLLRQSEPR